MKRSLRSWLWRVPLDQEIDEELSLHIELRTRELIERGMDPQAARELVLARIGDLGQLKRTCVDLGRKRDREMQLTRFLDELRQDVTGALRQMRAAFGFTAVAALTLALGIGANSAIFALADAVLLRPLPYANSDRLVFIDEHGPQQGGRSRIELLNFDEWTAQNRTFETMAAVWIPAAGGGPTLMDPDGTPEMLSSQSVTPQYFDVFGVRLGIALAAVILAAAPSFLPAELLPSVIELGVDARVVFFGVAMTCLIGVLFGLAPAWQATGISLVQAISAEGRTATSGRSAQFRHVLAAAEVAAAVLVLCGAGLLLRT